MASALRIFSRERHVSQITRKGSTVGWVRNARGFGEGVVAREAGSATQFRAGGPVYCSLHHTMPSKRKSLATVAGGLSVRPSRSGIARFALRFFRSECRRQLLLAFGRPSCAWSQRFVRFCRAIARRHTPTSAADRSGLATSCLGSPVSESRPESLRLACSIHRSRTIGSW